MTGAGWQALATLASGLMGSLFGGGGQQVTAEQRRLMDAQRGLVQSQTVGSNTENAMNALRAARMNAQDPLFRALQMMAFSRLPVFARQGINMDMSQPVAGAATAPTPEGSRPRGLAEILGQARRRV